MKTLKLYSVRVWDGGDKQDHKFYLSSKEEADKYVLSNKCDMVVEVSLDILDSLDEISEWKTTKVKERALAKLTKEERSVLGLE